MGLSWKVKRNIYFDRCVHFRGKVVTYSQQKSLHPVDVWFKVWLHKRLRKLWQKWNECWWPQTNIREGVLNEINIYHHCLFILSKINHWMDIICPDSHQHNMKWYIWNLKTRCVLLEAIRSKSFVISSYIYWHKFHSYLINTFQVSYFVQTMNITAERLCWLEAEEYIIN